jgi:PKD domain
VVLVPRHTPRLHRHGLVILSGGGFLLCRPLVKASPGGSQIFNQGRVRSASEESLRGKLLGAAGAALVVVVFAVLVAGAGAVGSSSSGGWLPPTVGLDPQGGSDAGVGIGPDGVAVAAWRRTYGSDELYTRVSTRGVSHRWGAPSTPVSGFLTFQRFAVDGRGDVLLTGVRSDGSRSRVVGFERPGNSAIWKGPIAIDEPADWAGGPSLAANDAGQAVVGWRSIDRYGDIPVIRAALRRTDGSWETPQNLGYGDSDPPSVAIDARGDAVAVWERDVSPPVVYAEFRPAGGNWGPATVLSEGGGATVRMNRRGDAVAVWVAGAATGHDGLVSSFRGAGTSTWTPPSPIPTHDPTGGVGYYGLSFVLDEAGKATLVAEHGNGEVEALTRSEAGDWSEPVALGDAGSSDRVLTDTWCVHPDVAVDVAGDAVAVWGGADLHAARRRAGSSVWEPAQIAAPGPACFELALAVDPAGDAVVIWNASEMAVTRLDASVLDVTPPALKALVFPRTAPVGRRLRFAVSATDLWSDLANPPLWRFGDGTTGRGFRVRHVFRRAGRYQVRLTAVDQAGNAATSTATARVTAPR